MNVNIVLEITALEICVCVCVCVCVCECVCECVCVLCCDCRIEAVCVKTVLVNTALDGTLTVAAAGKQLYV